jgi:gamma-glutamylcysteine synthetase
MIENNKMDGSGVARLKQHADLVQQLVKQVPAALAKPGLTQEQASRLHKVIRKGVDDFNEVQELVNGPESEETYQRAASSLAKIWAHLSAAAEAKMQDLAKDDGTGADAENSDK